MTYSAQPGGVTVDYGPMQMAIYAGRGGRPMTEWSRAAAEYAVKVLGELAAFKESAKKPQAVLRVSDGFPAILNTMIDAVTRSGDATLTPMAAVAGAIADLVADFLAEQGATKVVVNNGGDIALRLGAGESTTVGVAPAIGDRPAYYIKVTGGDCIGGITTSGMGGRSFTKGIASAAVIVASRAALADACATSVANAVYVPHPAIKLAYAGTIDPESDIADHLVVTEVGELPEEVISTALGNGYRRARELFDGGLIKGAALFVGERGLMLPTTLLSPLKP
jgi:uncharacterized protein